MTVSVPNLPYDFCQAPKAAPYQGFMFKNGYDAWFYDSTTNLVTQITDTDFPGYHTYSVGLTSVGTVATATVLAKAISALVGALGVATATTTAPHGRTTGDLVKINGVGGIQQNITSLIQSVGVATATFSVAHGYTLGQVIVITGALPNDYNGVKIITSITALTLTYVLLKTNTSSPAELQTPAVPATPTSPAIAAVPITASSTVIVEANGTNTAYSISALTQAVGVATATTTVAHGYVVGQNVIIAGAIVVTYNGVKVITTVADSTHFTFAIASATASPAGGVLTVITKSALTQVNGIATFSSTAHGLQTGNTVTISGATDALRGVNTIWTEKEFVTTGELCVCCSYLTLAQSSITPSYYGPLETFGPHGYAVGDQIVIASNGLEIDANYNGIYIIVSAADGATAFGCVGGSSAQPQIKMKKVNGSITALATRPTCILDARIGIPLPPSPTLQTVTTQRSVIAYNGIQVITVINPNSFTYPVAATAAAVASGSPITAALDYSAYNGIKQITVVNATTFTYPLLGNPPSPAIGTITYIAPHGLTLYDSVTIAGATPVAYNGLYTVTGIQFDFFTYTFVGGASPATGTITAVGGSVTTRGLEQLDGYFNVMTLSGRLFSSANGNAYQWNALNFLDAKIEPGLGVALTKSASYLVALKEWSTEFFYDAGNAQGSPLAPILNAFQLIGCASADSVAKLNGNPYWVSQTRGLGRNIYCIKGTQLEQVGTESISRILDLSTLATVYSYGLSIAGANFYILTLIDLNKTLVYEANSKSWALWSSLTLNASSTAITAAVIANGVVTVTATAHGMSDGDTALIAGATPSGLNGQQVITYISANSFSYATSAVGTVTVLGTITRYLESYFKYTKYIKSGGKNLLQHETNGTLCEISPAVFQDTGNPINCLMRTSIIDNGNTLKKVTGSVEILGDKVAGTAYLRFSNDDYNTVTKYRSVNLNSHRARVLRCGNFRRRSFELRYQGNTTLRLESLELPDER